MSAIGIARNCSPACAEMLGGHCEGADCPYAPDDSAPLSLIPFLDFDWKLAEDAAYARGLRMGHRNARIQYRQGVTVGFWTGVGAMFAAMFILAIIDWIVGA